MSSVLHLFFTDPSVSNFSPLSLHDALPILTAPSLLLRLRNPKPSDVVHVRFTGDPKAVAAVARALASVVTVTGMRQDRKSTRLNSSHVKISYAVFCLKKKNRQLRHPYALYK